MAKKKESYFWTSYSDLMTNLFFVMLVLFVLAIALLNREVVATKAELAKITEIREAIQKIDTTYFSYDPEYKKHILKTQVQFRTGSSDINDLDRATKDELIEVRNTIKKFLDELMKKDTEASYLLIIEGQASKDNYYYNNQLSYDRALALFKFWFPEQKTTNLKFYDLPCEVVIAGAGSMDGKPRAERNSANQRFLIQIMPKPGLVD